MGWWADFTGKTARRQIDQAHTQAMGNLDKGETGALGETRTGYANAQNFLAPYAQQGWGANKLYSDALGVNGYGAQQAFGQHYAASDPFRQQNEDNATAAILRRYNAMGSRSSGAAALAAARANEERGSQDYNNYLSRLGQFAGQGQQVAGQQSALSAAEGAQLANILAGFAQQRAGASQSYGNAQAQASTIGPQNFMNIFGSVARMFGGK